MVGNDVIDLTDPEARPGASHPRFDARVFAPAEQERLRASGSPHRLRWMFWAAKEAAFKLLRKLDAGTVFSPARFVVRLEADLRGEVRCGDRVLPVRLRERTASIHAIATDAELPEASILSATALLGEAGPGAAPSPSDLARSLALEHIARRLGVAAADLEIARAGRVPTVRYRGADTPLDLSLSHHGRLVAFACDVPLHFRAGSSLP